jgi:hypothetical protein
MADYFSILSRVIATLDPNVEVARRTVYGRARRALLDQLHAVRPRLPEATIRAELSALERAIRRIESEIASAEGAEAVEGERAQDRIEGAPIRRIASALARLLSSDFRVFILMAAVAALIILTVYAYWPGQMGGNTSDNSLGPDSSLAEVDDLEPGVDGGSSGADLPYILRRQPVFYRNTEPIGTIVIDKPQRFLYLVQANVTALRYGIGVGQQCLDLVGLVQISRKEEWPEWQLSPGNGGRGSRVMAGGPGNPLGARVLYLDTPDRRIHGTNTPKSIGHVANVGCFRLVNDDVVDLYNRVSIGSKVRIKN